ncbi:hypothetical protein [Streptomyces sp. NPDC020681]|uniref:hypothetical protein n=1 Tax=Streptomyces sp. NPDC020681 TaxID=3365083 RepID=UPI0037BC1EFA
MSRAVHRSRYAIRRHTRTGGVAAGVCVALFLSACGSDADPDTGSDSSSTPAAAAAGSPAPTATADPQDTAEADVIAAYSGYWSAKVAAYAHANIKGTKFTTYAVAEARAAAKREVAALSKHGYVATGKPRTAPAVTTIETRKKVPSATIRDCVDVSAWTLVDQATKQPVDLPKVRLTRYVSTVTAELWNGRWVILKATQENQSC